MAIQKYFVEVDTYGYTRWYKDQACTTLHRLGGPAVTHVSGTCTWVVDGQAHREDGPAAIRADGTKEWYQNDQLHRTDGPAMEYANGGKSWFLNGTILTQQQHQAQTAPVQEMTMADIEAALGKRVKIIK